MYHHIPDKCPCPRIDVISQQCRAPTRDCQLFGIAHPNTSYPFPAGPGASPLSMQLSPSVHPVCTLCAEYALQETCNPTLHCVPQIHCVPLQSHNSSVCIATTDSHALGGGRVNWSLIRQSWSRWPNFGWFGDATAKPASYRQESMQSEKYRR